MPADVQPASSANMRKRKRPGSGDDSVKLQSAGINMEKLMKKLGNEEAETPQKKEKRARTEGDKTAHRMNKRHEKPRKGVKKDASSSLLGSLEHASNLKQNRLRNEGAVRKKEGQKKNNIQKKKDTQEKESVHDGVFDAHLTSLQTRMKQSLDGARFRY